MSMSQNIIDETANVTAALLPENYKHQWTEFKNKSRKTKWFVSQNSPFEFALAFIDNLSESQPQFVMANGSKLLKVRENVDTFRIASFRNVGWKLRFYLSFLDFIFLKKQNERYGFNKAKVLSRKQAKNSF